MKIISLSILFLAFVVLNNVEGQVADSVTLMECYRLARENAPQYANFQLNEQSVEIEQDKLSSTNRPQVSIFGKAWYQSDAMEVSIPAIGVNMGVDNFQYNAGVNVDQKIYDGGMVSIQKEISTIEGEIKNLETENNLYKLYELVNAYFFGMATVHKSFEALELKMQILEKRKATVQSAVRNGVVGQSELERLDSEILYTKQQMKEIKLSTKKLENGLKELLGVDYENSFQITLPQEVFVPDSIHRVENELFEMNRNRIETIKTIQDRRYYPKLYAYGQAGYSYPGLNFFENQSAAYYIVGAKLAWNIFDWKAGKKEKQLLNVNKERINISEDNFNRNLQLNIQNQLDELSMLEELIEDDGKIIEAKEKIEENSASAFANGTITSVDYIEDLNAVLKARIDANSRSVRLLQARANLALQRGINIDNSEIK